MFDQLSHLIGLDFLGQDKLFFFPELKILLSAIDNALYAQLSQPDIQWCVLSAFSHVPCRGTLNLNDVLRQGNLLAFKSHEMAASRASAERETAIAALSRTGAVSSSGLRSLEGRLDLARTVAASPVAGCVFINRKPDFTDGTIDRAAYSMTRSEVRDYLTQALRNEYGDKVTIEENPVEPKDGIPDLLIAIEGVEFNDLESSAPDNYPRTTHGSKGFVIASAANEQTSETLKPIDIASILLPPAGIMR
jgi:hypothetical protein